MENKIDEEIIDESCKCGEHLEDKGCKCNDHEGNGECNCNDDCGCECDCDDCSDNAHGEVEEYNETENEIEMLHKRLEELDNKAKYAQAELVNYRKRKDEEVSNMLKFANQDLIGEIIPILDNFERAIKLAKAEDEKLNSFLDGFKMLYSHFSETLKKFGVEEIDALGKEFDPNLHLALLTDKDESKENEIVLEVLLKGYTLRGKMIRPASVKINKID